MICVTAGGDAVILNDERKHVTDGRTPAARNLPRRAETGVCVTAVSQLENRFGCFVASIDVSQWEKAGEVVSTQLFIHIRAII